jgi:mRNA-degrading endonuclease RelE of RelBE toxin-antitoxin system
VSKLRGVLDVFRVRVGDHRVLYQVLDARVLVLIVRIGDRREVYRSTDLRRLRRALRRGLEP